MAPLKGTGRRIVEPVDGGTRLTFAAEGHSGLFFNLAEPLVAWAIRRELSAALANVKKMLEAQDEGEVWTPPRSPGR